MSDSPQVNLDYKSSSISFAANLKTNAIVKSDQLWGRWFICSIQVASSARHDLDRRDTKRFISIVLTIIPVLVIDIEKRWEKTYIYFDVAHVLDWGAVDASKYDIRVVDEGNSLQVFLIRPKPIVFAMSSFDCACYTGFLLHGSKMVGFQSAVASAGTSSAQLIESRDLINLPSTVPTNITKRLNMGIKFADCWSFPSTLRFIKEKIR